MTQPNPSTAMARAVMDELARGGVTLVAISPGSRSAALAIAASEHPRLETRVVLDERSAAFFALGRAKASGYPAAVVSTSGTAPANYFPAVVEADMSLTPLVVLSADRPRELRGVGANQTIDQRRLFGGKVRRYTELAAPGSGTDLNHLWRSTTAEAVARSLGWGGRPGPVHLNVAFREPTVPVSADGRSRADPYPHPIEGSEEGRPWLQLRVPDPPAPVMPSLGEPKRPMLVVGEGEFDPTAVEGNARRLGWPVLATALSDMRDGSAVSAYHHILGSGIPEGLRPDLVVAVGALGPSPRLESLASSAPVVVRVDRWRRLLDPERSATHLVHADPVAFLSELAPSPTEPGWADRWVRADEAARKAMDEVLDQTSEMTGAGTVRSLADTGLETLVAASSLPIREVDAHLCAKVEVLGNRGASGIDGFVSTARGVASARRAAVALSGDLSLLHDQNGLLPEPMENLVIVVLDNEGGGLFDSLPLQAHALEYERLFLAPPRRDLELLARYHGIDLVTATDPVGVSRAVTDALEAGGIQMVRVPIDRETDLRVRRDLDRAAADAV